MRNGRRATFIGKLRPDIVLYNEVHPKEELIHQFMEEDLKHPPDVMLILGTSLKVEGFKHAVRHFAKEIHRTGGHVIFINRTKVAESQWRVYFDYWIDWDCDEWVNDLQARIPQLWDCDSTSSRGIRNSSPQGGGVESNSPTATVPMQITCATERSTSADRESADGLLSRANPHPISTEAISQELAERTNNETSNHDDIIILSPNQLQQVAEFRKEMRLCQNDRQRYNACVRVRDKILRQNVEVQLLAAACESIMLIECTEYKRRKELSGNPVREPSQRDEEDMVYWREFFGIAQSGHDIKSKCLAPLETVARHWGQDRVQHYQWALRGERFCNLLCAAARKTCEWKKAARILNLSMLKRTQEGKSLKQRPVQDTASPIEQRDLQFLRQYPSGQSTHTTPALPPGFELDKVGLGFDKFGIMVRKQYAVPTTESEWPEAQAISVMRTSLDPNLAFTPNETEQADERLVNDVFGHALTIELDDDMGTSHMAGNNEAQATTSSTARVLRERPQNPNPSYRDTRVDRRYMSKQTRRAIIPKVPSHMGNKTGTTIPPAMTTDASPRRHRRAASLSNIDQYMSIPKRQRLDGLPSYPDVCLKRSGITGECQMHEPIADDIYRKRFLLQLKGNPKQFANFDTRGLQNDKPIVDLLQRAESPNTDEKRGPVEALFLTGTEAADYVESDKSDLPLFTAGQQHFKWGSGRPIVEFLRRMGYLDPVVSVLVPSSTSFASRTLSQVRERFLANEDTNDPWSVLGLRSPLPSTLPDFLMGENCQLLPRIKDAIVDEGSASAVASTKQWKDDEQGVFLLQGGYSTSPHKDFLPTWITVQEGQIGFSWMSIPTKQEEKEWEADPSHFAGGRWRFTILKEQQTVFFKSTTIYFAFQLHGKQTLGLTGHILQWSGIEQWVQTVIRQMRNPRITNEDITGRTLQYGKAVEKLVSARARCGKPDEIHGELAIRRVLNLLKEFEKQARGCRHPLPG